MSGAALSDEGVENLVFGIIRRALIDYYNTCMIRKKLPKRPKTDECKRGKKVGKRPMTDHEFHMWLVTREMDRRRLKADALAFLYSDWYRTLTGKKYDNTSEIDKLIAVIEEKRRLGVPLFEDEENEESEDY